MALGKKAPLLLLLPVIIIIMTACGGNFYLTSPYIVDGDITFFLDGMQVGSSRFDDDLDWDMADFKLVIRSDGDGDIDKVDELSVFHRTLTAAEIYSLYDDPGGMPDDTTDLALEASFDSTLSSDTGPDGSDESGKSVVEYDTGIKSQALVVDGNDLTITYDSSALPAEFGEMTLNIWFYEETDFSESFPIIEMQNMNDEDECISLKLEDLILSVYSDDMQEINYYTLFGFSAGFWHMATIVVDYYSAQ